MRFNNSVVIVTGSGAGIGKSAALAFAREGAKVIVNSVSTSALDTLKEIEAAGGEGMFIQGDVSNFEVAKNIVKQTIEAYGRIDVLANVAGITLGGTPINTTEEDWNHMMDVNAKSVFYMMREVLPYMLEAGVGSIVNTSSIAAQKGLKNRFAYSATKGAVSAMSRAAAMEYVDKNIRINIICPGTILTPSLQGRIDNAPGPIKEQAYFDERQPIGRLGRPEEVAESILYAADPRAGFMTGTEININGGML